MCEVFFSSIDFGDRVGTSLATTTVARRHRRYTLPNGLSATLSRVFAVRDTFLYEGKELFNRAEFEFAAGVNFLNMALEFAFGGVGVRA
jgi:hypothetical protein